MTIKGKDLIDAPFLKGIVVQLGDHIEARGGSAVEAMLITQQIAATMISSISKSREMDAAIVLKLAEALHTQLNRLRDKLEEEAKDVERIH